MYVDRFTDNKKSVGASEKLLQNNINSCLVTWRLKTTQTKYGVNQRIERKKAELEFRGRIH